MSALRHSDVSLLAATLGKIDDIATKLTGENRNVFMAQFSGLNNQPAFNFTRDNIQTLSRDVGKWEALCRPT